MKLAMTSAECVRELTMYCLRRRNTCFEGWEPRIVFRYIAFHFLAGTIGIIKEGRAILGIGIAYSGPPSYFREREGKQFDWTLPAPGSALFMAEIIASKRAVPKLWKLALERYPWISTVLTYRRGKLVELHLSTIGRLARMEDA